MILKIAENKMKPSNSKITGNNVKSKIPIITGDKT